MLIESAIAPAYAQLRPLQDTATATFPVYRDLVGALATAEKHPDDTVAHVLATCAGYAYARLGMEGGAAPKTLATIMARLGLADNQIRYIYHRDVVPHLPSRDSGNFAHFGQEFRYDGKWRRKQQEKPSEFGDYFYLTPGE